MRCRCSPLRSPRPPRQRKRQGPSLRALRGRNPGAPRNRNQGASVLCGLKYSAACPPTREMTVSRLLRALLAASLALPPAAALAQAPTPPAGQPAAQPAFEIRGKITDTANAPIPQASVSLRLKANG